MKRNGKGFTLIELLVVVAIIAVLISILLPALARARDISRCAVCAANQRSVGQAMLMYTQDYAGWFPPAWGPMINSLGGGWDSWTGFLIRLGYIKMTNSVDRMNVLRCPSSRYAINESKGYYYRTYAVNDYYWRAGNKPTFGAYRLEEFENPSNTVRVCEEGAEVLDGVVNIGDFFSLPPEGMDFLHNDMMNVLWVDGHVGLLARKSTFPSLFMTKTDK